MRQEDQKQRHPATKQALDYENLSQTKRGMGGRKRRRAGKGRRVGKGEGEGRKEERVTHTIL